MPLTFDDDLTNGLFIDKHEGLVKVTVRHDALVSSEINAANPMH